MYDFTGRNITPYESKKDRICKLYSEDKDISEIVEITKFSTQYVRNVVCEHRSKGVDFTATKGKKEKLLQVVQSDILEILATRDLECEETVKLASTFEKLHRAERDTQTNDESTLKVFWDMLQATSKQNSDSNILDAEWSEIEKTEGNGDTYDKNIDFT